MRRDRSFKLMLSPLKHLWIEELSEDSSQGFAARIESAAIRRTFGGELNLSIYFLDSCFCASIICMRQKKVRRKANVGSSVMIFIKPNKHCLASSTNASL